MTSARLVLLMRTWVLPLAFFLGGISLLAQENCANAIDDDGDGLVDLNDTEDCSCALTSTTASLLPNPSFESFRSDQRGCSSLQPGGLPDAVNQANCLTDWQRASLGTTDSWNAFTLPGAGPYFPDRLPQPLPSGAGVGGFWVGIQDRPGHKFHNGDGTTTSRYREYLATCLIDGQQIETGRDYRLTFSLGFMHPQLAIDTDTVDIQSPGPVELSVYGVRSCDQLDFGAFYGCPEEAAAEGYELIANITVAGTPGQWTHTELDFTAAGTYAGFAIGGSCAEDRGRPDGSAYRNYYFIDELILNTRDRFTPPVVGPISVDGLTVCEPITLSAEPKVGATYQWYRNGVAVVGATSPTLSLPPSFSLDGRYRLSVSTAAGCAVSEEVVIQRPVITDQFPDTVAVCGTGDTAVITPRRPGAATFAWSDGSTRPALRITESGTYSVTVTEACIEHTETFVAKYEAPLDYTIRTTPERPCIGDTVTVEVLTNAYAPNFAFRSLPEEAMLPSIGGKVRVVAGLHGAILAFISSGCERRIDTIHTTAAAPIEVTAVEVEDIVCGVDTGSISIAVVNPARVDYTWFDPAGSKLSETGPRLSVTTPGDYLVRLTDGRRCNRTLSVSVASTTSLSAHFSATEISCHGAGAITVAQLSGQAPFGITWTRDGAPLPDAAGEQTLSDLPPGDYAVTVSDATGCSLYRTFTLSPYRPMQVEVNSAFVDCTNPGSGSISVTVAGGKAPYRYELVGSTPQPSPLFENLTEGRHEIIVWDSTGCDAPAAAVTLHAPPDITIQGDGVRYLRMGESTVLSLGSEEATPNPGQVSWQPTRGLSCSDCTAPAAAPTETTEYTVTHTTLNGCSSTARVLVVVDETLQLYVPNAFSPNGDDRNDTFHAYPGRGVAAVTDLRVYDRWGELIWVQDSAEDTGWDGTFRGKPLTSAVFTYTGRILLINGKSQPFAGSVTLID